MDYSAVCPMLLCFVLIAGTSVAVDDHHFNSLQPHPSHYVMNERMSMLQESGSSMARHEKRDAAALLSFRNAITADPHGLLSNWTAHNSANICSWNGIRCRKHTRRVVSIYLPFSGLEGTLSPSLGSVPGELGLLQKLEILELSGNNLESIIPPSLGNCSSLTALGMGTSVAVDDHHFNSLQPHPSHYVMNERMSMLQESGSSMARHDKRDAEALLSFRNAITADPHGLLSNWTAHNSANICSWNGISCRKQSRRVVSIDLSLSGLEGATLSPSLGNLSLLRTLDLWGNKLRGRIPPEFGQLKALQRLYLGYNLLSRRTNL